LKGENILQVFKNKALRKIVGAKKDKVGPSQEF
jgi:hypothetical protein